MREDTSAYEVLYSQMLWNGTVDILDFPGDVPHGVVMAYFSFKAAERAFEAASEALAVYLYAECNEGFRANFEAAGGLL